MKHPNPPFEQWLASVAKTVSADRAKFTELMNRVTPVESSRITKQGASIASPYQLFSIPMKKVIALATPLAIIALVIGIHSLSPETVTRPNPSSQESVKPAAPQPSTNHETDQRPAVAGIVDSIIQEATTEASLAAHESADADVVIAQLQTYDALTTYE